MEEIENLLRLRRPGGVLDPGINVFRVFAEDHHVDFLRMFDRRGDAFEVLHWAQTNEKIEKLPKRDVKRTNAAADRRRQRTFNADEIFAERIHRVVRQPGIEFVLGRLTREHFEPCYFLFVAERFLYRGIEHAHARRPNVGAGAIASDERNDRVVRHIEPVGSGNFFAIWRSDIFVRHKALTVSKN